MNRTRRKIFASKKIMPRNRVTLESITLIATTMFAVLGITVIGMHSTVLARPNANGGSLATINVKGPALADAPSTISLGSDSSSSDNHNSRTGNSRDNAVQPDSSSSDNHNSRTGNSRDNAVQEGSSHTGHIEGEPQLEYYNVCINHHCYNYHNPASKEN
jgi:hypothetical protein